MENQLGNCAFLKVKKMSDDATLPVRSNPTDAGLDLFSVDEVLIPPSERTLVHTNIILEIPEGFYGRVAPRSGLAVKNGINVLAGVIDSGYRGEIIVVLHNTSNADFVLPSKSKVAQLIIEAHFNFPIIEITQLSDTERGANGFGSSGS